MTDKTPQSVKIAIEAIQLWQMTPFADSNALLPHAETILTALQSLDEKGSDAFDEGSAVLASFFRIIRSAGQPKTEGNTTGRLFVGEGNHVFVGDHVLDEIDAALLPSPPATRAPDTVGDETPLRNQIEKWDQLQAICGRVETYTAGTISFANACDELESFIKVAADKAAMKGE